MRNAAQCVGRVIRGKDDYGVLIFADIRYSRPDKYNKLPKWIKSYISPLHNNLSTDEAVLIARRFLKDMAQPLQKEEVIASRSALWGLDRVLEQPFSRHGSLYRRSIEKTEEVSVSHFIT